MKNRALAFFAFVTVILAVLPCAPTGVSCASTGGTEVGILKYKGGGDWYSAGRALANLCKFIDGQTGVPMASEPVAVEPSSGELLAHPVIFINGHGNISFSQDDVTNLRAYFNAGGFLFANDDYGMDLSFRREMKKVFPESEWAELPFSHPIYHTLYSFTNGLPKIHEHDKLPPRGYGLFYNGVMICFYDVECDLADGWEAEEIHGDPPAKRTAALQMGANVIIYALTRGVE
jgi:hypothetical protein